MKFLLALIFIFSASAVPAQCVKRAHSKYYFHLDSGAYYKGNLKKEVKPEWFVHPELHGSGKNVMDVEVRISKKGRLKDVIVIRGINPEIDKKTVKMFKSLTGGWNPGYCGARAVNSIAIIKIRYEGKLPD